jgi:hypothetical protein
MTTQQTINGLAIETIRQPGDALGACIKDALLCGTRVVVREPVRETPLHRALVESMWQSRGWRE